MRHLILFIALASSAALANTPEETIRNYVERVKAGGMESVTGLMHPDELVKFQNMLGPVIDDALKDEEGRAVFSRFADGSDQTRQRQLDPEAFMTEFFRWLETVQPQISQILKSSSIEVLGHVKEGEVSHVVARFRTKFQGFEIEKMTVMSTKDHRGAARMMLSGEIKQLAETLRARRR